MAIALKNLLLFAEENDSIMVNHLDGTTSTLPFFQRSFDYGDNPPLVIKDLPEVNKETNGALDLIGQVTDNFVRGGAIALGNAVIDDLKRLGKVLISPNGLAWSAAQLSLSLTNPKNLISPRNRLTLPISVFATAGTGAAGIRFRKDGLIDIKTESGFNYNSTRGGPKYESSLLELSTLDIDDTSDHTIRGTHFYINEGGFEGREDLIKSYKGGAHSTFGIGNTEIKRYKSTPYGLNSGNEVNKDGYLPLFNQDLFSLRQGPNATKANSGTSTISYVDYRNKTGKKQRVKSTRIGLYHLGDPGAEDLSNKDTNVYSISAVDKISAASIFKRQDLESFEGTFKDYIKFRIAVVDTDNPLNDNIILFRALLDNVADSFSGEWNSYKYNGRAEKFYTYGGFDRSISFGFKIHTQTRHEQKPLWRKLNYLVAQTAPEYKNRRMRGVFSRLTIGDWMNEIPGFFTSINLGWNTAYPWEIRYDSDGADADLNEYPHILDVSCTFQPVHNFAPSNSPTTPFILPEIGVNGNRRYARQSDNENQDQFGTNGVASSPENATNIVNSPPPPAPPPALNPVPTPSNDITPIEERGLLT